MSAVSKQLCTAPFSFRAALKSSFRFSALLFALLGSSLGAASETEDVHAVAEQLTSAKLRQVPGILTRLEELGGEKVLPLFEAMLAGRLYFRRSGKQLVVLDETQPDENTRAIADAFSGEALAPVGKREIKKVRVNNRLRGQLRRAIARLTLFADDPVLRESAVLALMRNLNADNVELLQQAAVSEQDADILQKIDLALAVAGLESADDGERLAAIARLRGNLEPVVRNRLQALVAVDDDGIAVEGNAEIVAAALQSLDEIEDTLGYYRFVERVFFGLSLGSVLLLAAIGLSITFGVMGVINMAHGELLMLGAYTTYVVQLLMPNHLNWSLVVAVPAAFVVCGLVGIAIERGVIQFLKGRPLETLLATFGISLILQQAVRTVFSPLNRQVSTPEWMSGALQINPGLALTYNRLYITLFSLMVFVGLLLVMKRTSLGLYVRAVSQNRDMARAVGIRSGWVDAMTFGLGAGIAGIGGVALSQLTNVGPNLGQSYIVDSFMVVVFGGVGNLWGTLVAAFSLGVFSKFMEPVTGTVLAQIIVLVFIVLFIQKRPRGLFPQQGRSAD